MQIKLAGRGTGIAVVLAAALFIGCQRPTAGTPPTQENTPSPAAKASIASREAALDELRARKAALEAEMQQFIRVSEQRQAALLHRDTILRERESILRRRAAALQRRARIQGMVQGAAWVLFAAGLLTLAYGIWRIRQKPATPADQDSAPAT